MKLPKYVKRKNGFWKVLPKLISENTAQSIYPFIFLPEKIYGDLLSKSPKKESIAIFLHEKIHYQRQKDLGIVWFIKYLLLSKFRLNEELLAFKEQIKYLKKHNLL